MNNMELTIKKILNHFFNLLVITIIIFFFEPSITNATDNIWTEVSKNSDGTQYLDKDSLIIKDKGIVEIKTKYLITNAVSSKTSEEYIYTMQINCTTNKYKDISVNGKNNLRAKWEDPDGDKLIMDIIKVSCNNV